MGLLVLRILNTCVLDTYVVPVVWSVCVQGSFYEFQFVEWARYDFWRLVGNFLYFNSHFRVTNLGLNLFSGVYLNKLLFLWCQLTDKQTGKPDYAFLCLKTEPELASETSCFLKIYNGWSPRKRKLCNFNRALFSFLFTHDDLVMQALVWPHMVQFRVIWFGSPV